MKNLLSGPPSEKLSEQSVTPNNNRLAMCLPETALGGGVQNKTDPVLSSFLNKNLPRTSIFHNESQNLQ